MSNPRMTLETIAADAAHLIEPFVAAVIIIVVLLVLKDAMMKMAKGLLFKLTSDFKAGDEVIIDGEHAIIVNIGLLETRFGIFHMNGDEKLKYKWRIVDNSRISFMKIEKIVSDNINIHAKEKDLTS